MDSRSIGVWDYVVLAVMLALSMIVGVYAAFSGGRQRTSAEYMLGNRKMNFVSVGLSIASSFTASPALLGHPAEIYLFGTTFWWNLVGLLIGAIFAAYTTIPLFYRLNITSIYAYLELRYNRALRNLVTAVFMLQYALLIAIILYTPALAINAVTGLSLEISILITGGVCLFYTTIGGIKAVVWVDAFQSIVMIAGVIAVMAVSASKLGGFGEAWRIADEGGRIVWFDTRLDFTLRNTFWLMVIPHAFHAIDAYSSQINIQRCLSCSSVENARRSVLFGNAALFTYSSLLYLCGVVMYAYYRGCDPVYNGQIGGYDQLFPLLVSEVFENVPGMTGLFLASVMSATMSTVSSAWNAMAAVFGEGVIKSFWPNINEDVYARSGQLMSFLIGVFTIGLAFLVPYLGRGLVLLIGTIFSFGSGITACFIMGVFTHRCNWKGGIAGLLASLAIVIWITVGAYLYPAPNHSLLPVSVDGCPVENATTYPYTTEGNTRLTSYWPSPPGDVTEAQNVDSARSPLEGFYALSFNTYPVIAFAVSAIVNIIVSGATGFNDPSKVDNKLIVNVRAELDGCLPKKWRKDSGHSDNYDVNDSTDKKNGIRVNEGFELDDVNNHSP